MHILLALAMLPGLALPVPLAQTPAFPTPPPVNWEKLTELPWVIPVQELPEDFRAYHLVIRGEGDTMLMRLMMFGAMFAGEGTEVPSLMQFSNLYWMRPEVPAGAHFVFAYRLDLGDMFPVLGQPTGARPLQNLKLRLHRIRVDDISVFSARPDLTRTDLLASVAGTAEQAATPRTEAEARTRTITNAKQVALGLLMYAADYDEVFPFVQSTAGAREVTQPYMRSVDFWATFNPNGGTFLMSLAVAGVRTADIKNPETVPLVYESRAWPDGTRVVAFADGHCRFVNAEEWAQIESLLRARFTKTGRPLPADLGVNRPLPRARAVPAAVG